MFQLRWSYCLTHMTLKCRHNYNIAHILVCDNVSDISRNGICSGRTKQCVTRLRAVMLGKTIINKGINKISSGKREKNRININVIGFEFSHFSHSEPKFDRITFRQKNILILMHLPQMRRNIFARTHSHNGPLQTLLYCVIKLGHCCVCMMFL